MNEFILYVFISVMEPTDLVTESTLVYPQVFISEEACYELNSDENRNIMFRYLQVETEGTIVNMELKCVGDISSMAEYNE
jgi:hypothetical protein